MRFKIGDKVKCNHNNGTFKSIIFDREFNPNSPFDIFEIIGVKSIDKRYLISVNKEGFNHWKLGSGSDLTYIGNAAYWVNIDSKYINTKVFHIKEFAAGPVKTICKFCHEI